MKKISVLTKRVSKSLIKIKNILETLKNGRVKFLQKKIKKIAGMVGVISIMLTTLTLPTHAAGKLGPKLFSVSVTPASPTITVGSTTLLTATPLDQLGAPFVGATVSFASGDSLIATVNAGGVVTGVVAGGPINIIVTADDGAGGIVTAFAPVTVNPNPNTPPPPAPPLPVSATTDATGSIVSITFDKVMSPSVSPSGFAVSVNGVADSIIGAAVNPAGSATIALSIATTILSAQTVSVTYAPGTVTATDGTVLGGFVNLGATNASTVAPSTNATLSSTAYTVNNTLHTITNVLASTTPSVVLSNLTPAAGATIFGIFQTNGFQENGLVLTGDTLQVIAQDGITTNTYTITTIRQPQTISFSVLTGKTYGAADFSVSATSSSGLTVAFTATGSCTATSTLVHITGLGSCTVTASQAGDANFLPATNVLQTFSIAPAPLTVTALVQSKVYGTANPTLTSTTTGFVNGETAAVLTVPVALFTTATTTSPTGTYPITPSGATSPNYTITFVPSTLTVTSAPLTITANLQSRPFGTANPTLTSTTTGFVNGDTLASLATPVVLSTTALITSPAGTYPITVSGATSPNYTITFVPSVLTVTPVITLTFVTVTPGTATIGVGGTQLTVSLLDQNGVAFTGTTTIVWSSSNTAVATVSATGTVTGLASGTTTITASATNGASTVTGTATITVTPVLTTVTIASSTVPFLVSTTQQLTANPLDQSGVAFVGATVTWASNNPAIASINPTTGLITAVGAGTANITATAVSGTKTVTSTTTITVVSPVLTSVTITSATSTITASGTQAFTVILKDQTGGTFSGATVTWSSSNTAVATVNATGTVTGVSSGTSTIIATAVSGSTTVTGTSVITVLSPTPVPTPSICITGADTNGDGVISTLEILNYIRGWKTGNVLSLLLLKAIGFWKVGAGC